MNATELLTGPLAQAIGWALLHLLWQATIVAGILAAVLSLMSRQTANARYVVSCGALSLVFAMFVATAVRAYDPAAPPIVVATSSVASDTVQLSLTRIPVLLAETAAVGLRDRALVAVSSARRALPSIVAIWLLGVILLSARLLVSWRTARRLAHRGAQTANADWQRVAARLSDALGLRRAVTLLESAAVEVPSVIGTLRPIILLPASALTGLTAEQIEMVLAHELAHIRRHDFLVNLLQAVVETLMFYHPAVWWMSHRVRIERENCCDDLAVAVCGNPIQYARTLTRLEELRASALPVVVAANGGSLLDRIRRIAGGRAEGSSSSPRWAAAVAMLSILILAVAVPSLPALAQREQKKTETAKPATATVEVVEPTEETTAVVTETPEADLAVDADLDDADLAMIDYEFTTPEPPEPPTPAWPRAALIAPMVAPAVAPVMAPMAAPAVAPVTPVPAVPFAPRALAYPTPMVTPMPAIAPAPMAVVAPAMPMITPRPARAPRAPRTPVAMWAGNDFNLDLDGDDDQESDRELGAGGKLTVDELISLRATGVTPAYVNTMRELFPGLTLRQVTSLSAVGVTPEYLREMRDAGFEVKSAHEAAGLRAVGVTADYVKQLRSAGFEVKSARDATSMRAVGVTPEYVQQMRSAGFEVKTAQDATSLSAVGVTPDYVKEMRAAGFEIKSAHEATSLRAVGVTPDYVKEMRAAGFEIKSAHDATNLRALGVTSDWIREMRAAGVKIESPKEASNLRALGVTADFVKRLAKAGYTNLTAHELSRLAAAGVDEDFIRDMEQYRKKN